MQRERDASGRFPTVNRIARVCDNCGKGMLLLPWQINRRPGQNKFCSKKCTYEGRAVTKTFEIGHAHLVSKEAHKRAGMKISKSLTGRKLSAEHCKKLGDAKRGKKLSADHIRKSLARRPMSSLEEKFNEIIIKNNLPYKFVGNGAFFIERKNPDFININGEKIAIEVFYMRHKQQFRGGANSWIRNRKYVFRKYGWKVFCFDETKVKEPYILQRLGGCHRK